MKSMFKTYLIVFLFFFLCSLCPSQDLDNLKHLPYKNICRKGNANLSNVLLQHYSLINQGLSISFIGNKFPANKSNTS